MGSASGTAAAPLAEPGIAVAPEPIAPGKVKTPELAGRAADADAAGRSRMLPPVLMRGRSFAL